MLRCDQCRQILFDNNIFEKKDFLKWSVRGGHPDKGGDYKKFQEVSSCNDDFFGIHKKCSGGIYPTYNNTEHNYTEYNYTSEYNRRQEELRKKKWAKKEAMAKDPYYISKKDRMEKEKIERMNSLKKAKDDKRNKR